MTERPIFEPPHTLLVATEGWSDAGEAASSALRMVVEHFGLVPYEVISDEAYFDYQVTRPYVQIESDGSRVISWPDITLFGPFCDSRRRALSNVATAGRPVGPASTLPRC